LLKCSISFLENQFDFLFSVRHSGFPYGVLVLNTRNEARATTACGQPPRP
jgi:hypothetical protein